MADVIAVPLVDAETAPAAASNTAQPTTVTKTKKVKPKPTVAAKPKLSKPKSAKPAEHPKYSVMIADAINKLKERGGSSRQAILKYIQANYKVGTEMAKINAHLKSALRAGIKNGTLKQSKGTGASGSFRMGEKKTVSKPKKVQKPKAAAPKPKSPKKAASKKPKATKIPAGEKKAKMVKKPKSPKKLEEKKPKTAKSTVKKTKAPAKPKKQNKKSSSQTVDAQ